MDRTLAVRARGITKCFGEVVALDGVDVDITAGQIHGLVGPNGAGKTTLLGLLLGLSVPDRGRLEVLGSRVGGRLRGLDGVAGFVDGPALYPSLTARQNLTAVASLRGYDAASPAGVDGVLEQVGLTDVANDRVRGFSLGMRQRLGLAAALMTQPRLLVLDEPANGLDPAAKHQLHRILSALAEEGRAVVLSSHRMDDLAALCAEVTIVAAGRAVFTGPIAKLAAEGASDVDYRLHTSDAAVARRVAAEVRGLRLVSARGLGMRGDAEGLVVRGPVPVLDELVLMLGRAGVAVRELTPVVSPLEAAFLALTESLDQDGRNEREESQ